MQVNRFLKFWVFECADYEYVFENLEKKFLVGLGYAKTCFRLFVPHHCIPYQILRRKVFYDFALW